MQPMNFMTSLLGFFGANDTDSAETVKNGTFSLSPHGSVWGSRPDPAVRLRLTDDGKIRIFGFPPEDLPAAIDIPPNPFANIGEPPLLYLKTTVPAYVAYVMGSDWRKYLRDDYVTDERHVFKEGQVTLRPGVSYSKNETAKEEEVDWTGEEQSHCLLMRRIGAKAIRCECDCFPHHLPWLEGWRGLPERILGWPSNGGVWIARRGEFEERMREAAEMSEMNTEARDEAIWKASWYYESDTMLSQYKDMDELCQALQDVGAEYYANASDCPEVAEFGLDVLWLDRS